MERILILFFAGVILLVLVLTYLVPLSTGSKHAVPESSWKAGIFYSNRDDPALFVPKRFGIGYTLNFGNSWSWAVLALIVLLVAAPIFFAASSLRQMSHHLRH